jgi:hypothetical protein
MKNKELVVYKTIISAKILKYIAHVIAIQSSTIISVAKLAI